MARTAATEARLIRHIARRALDSIMSLRVAGLLSVDLQRELAACHRAGPLRLEALLAADPVSFATEIAAIRRGCAPRYAAGPIDGGAALVLKSANPSHAVRAA